MCISSNLQTGSAPNMDRHPFKFYLDLGLRVTLNTDNRLITNTTVTNEYLLAATHYKLSVEELRWVMVNGFKSAFLPFRDKKMLLRRVTAEYDRLIAERTGDPVDDDTKRWMGDPGHPSIEGDHE
jgi:adenosine deaminase